MHIDEQSPHLGGYCEGGDEATYYPELWDWLVNDYAVRSVLDVGCGEGHAVNYFRTIGIELVLGIDGVAQPNGLIAQHDYTTGPVKGTVLRASGVDRFDLCWCCEFLEHVEERYLPNVLKTFSIADTLLITHAFPGQSGHHHVNCRSADYWIGAMAAIGYQLDNKLTVVTRELASLNRNPYNHYLRSGMAFTAIAST